MEGSRVREDGGVVDEDMRLELELLESEYLQYAERVNTEAAKALEETMASVAELANEEHERLAQEWAAFEEKMMHVSLLSNFISPALNKSNYCFFHDLLIVISICIMPSS
jgi:hypothetical protein